MEGGCDGALVMFRFLLAVAGDRAMATYVALSRPVGPSSSRQRSQSVSVKWLIWNACIHDPPTSPEIALRITGCNPAAATHSIDNRARVSALPANFSINTCSPSGNYCQSRNLCVVQLKLRTDIKWAMAGLGSRHRRRIVSGMSWSHWIMYCVSLDASPYLWASSSL
jgi:hypothetical protein